MGGLGSGGWNRTHRSVVEGHSRIDAAYLQRHDMLRDDWAGSLIWRRAGQDDQSIKLSGGRDRIELRYAVRVDDGTWEPVIETVRVDWSPRRFGGAQAYLLCPACAARVRFLILAGPRFLCRHCNDLVHASTRERAGDRAHRRAEKLRARIGAEPGLDAPLGTKPKHMHHATYDRIVDQICAAEREVWDEALGLLMRAERRCATSQAGGFWS